MFHLTKLFSQFRCLPVPLLLTVSFLGLSNMPIKANPEERYQVSGDEAGKVTVVDADSGEVVNTFQIDEGGVIEETFVLDEGKTIAAAQNQQTIFWNLETGEEIGRVQGRMYNFFEGQNNRIITYVEKEEQTFTYSYPDLDSQCQSGRILELLENDYFRLSPDGRYLAVLFGIPFEPEDEAITKYIPSSGLYDLQSCSEIKIADHPALEPKRIGEFSPDSRYYFVEHTYFRLGTSFAFGAIKFDLQTGEIVEKIPDGNESQ
ncbi:MAG: hypothetical protein WA865_14865 [Spirulinaceae cyanobacterium]